MGVYGGAQTTGKNLRARGSGGPDIPVLAGRRLFPRRSQPRKKAVHHRYSAAQYYRAASYGARAGQHPAGYPDPLAADAGIRSVVDAGNRPRVHRHRSEDRGSDGERGAEEGRRRPRRLPGARLGLERHLREPDHRTAQEDGFLLRLGAGTLYAGRRLFQSGAGGVRPAVREGPDLPGRADHQLVPALPYLHLGRGGGV